MLDEGVVNASSQPEKDGHQHPPKAIQQSKLRPAVSKFNSQSHKVKVSDADAAAALVLAACHSLVPRLKVIWRILLQGQRVPRSTLMASFQEIPLRPQRASTFP